MGFKSDGVLVNEYTYDFAEDGGAVSTITLSTKANESALPTNAVVTKVLIKVVTACTSGGAATLTIGNTDSANVYLASTAVAALTANALFDYTTAYAVTIANKANLTMTIGTAAFTAGKIKVLVHHLLHE